MICFHDTTADKEEFKSLTPFNEWKASTSSTLALCQHSTNRRLCCTDFRRQKDFFFSKEWSCGGGGYNIQDECETCSCPRPHTGDGEIVSIGRH